MLSTYETRNYSLHILFLGTGLRCTNNSFYSACTDVPCNALTHLVAMRQVAAMWQVQSHDAVVRAEEGGVDVEVGR